MVLALLMALKVALGRVSGVLNSPGQASAGFPFTARMSVFLRVVIYM